MFKSNFVVQSKKGVWRPIDIDITRDDQRKVNWYNQTHITDWNTGKYYRAYHFTNIYMSEIRLVELKGRDEDRSNS